MPGKIEELRHAYHRKICTKVLRKNEIGTPNNADSGNSTSVKISKGIVDHIGFNVKTGKLPGQTAGSQFEMVTMDFCKMRLSYCAIYAQENGSFH